MTSTVGKMGEPRDPPGDPSVFGGPSNTPTAVTPATRLLPASVCVSARVRVFPCASVFFWVSATATRVLQADILQRK